MKRASSNSELPRRPATALDDDNDPGPGQNGNADLPAAPPHMQTPGGAGAYANIAAPQQQGQEPGQPFVTLPSTSSMTNSTPPVAQPWEFPVLTPAQPAPTPAVGRVDDAYHNPMPDWPDIVHSTEGQTYSLGLGFFSDDPRFADMEAEIREQSRITESEPVVKARGTSPARHAAYAIEQNPLEYQTSQFIQIPHSLQAHPSSTSVKTTAATSSASSTSTDAHSAQISDWDARTLIWLEEGAAKGIDPAQRILDRWKRADQSVPPFEARDIPLIRRAAQYFKMEREPSDESPPPLHRAAADNDIEVVKLLVDHGADIHAIENDGLTALQLAASRGSLAIVQFLIDRGANIHAKDEDDDTALHRAAEDGHPAIVQLLIDRGANIHAKGDESDTALHRAAANGHFDIVQLLINRGANIHATEDDGITALQLAASSGHLAIVQLLIDRGANINATDEDGETALHHAAACCHPAIVQLLIDHDADIHATSHFGDTALHRADDPATIQLLIDRGANINAPDEDGATALHRAALYGDPAIVQLLIDRGANINAVGKDGRTALDRADDEAIKACIAQCIAERTCLPSIPYHFLGATLRPASTATTASGTAATSTSSTASTAEVAPVPSLMSHALQSVRTAIIDGRYDATTVADRLRLAAGMSTEDLRTLMNALVLARAFGEYGDQQNPNELDEEIKQALTDAHLSAMYSASVKELTKLKENIDRYLPDGATLLTQAAQAGDIVMIQTLLRLGASVHLPDQKGHSALLVAAKERNFAAFAELLSHGAHANTSDSAGYSALYYLVLAFIDPERPDPQAIMKLISDLLLKGYRFDQANPDPTTRRKYPTLAKLLKSNPERDVQTWLQKDVLS